MLKMFLVGQLTDRKQCGLEWIPGSTEEVIVRQKIGLWVSRKEHSAVVNDNSAA